MNENFITTNQRITTPSIKLELKPSGYKGKSHNKNLSKQSTQKRKTTYGYTTTKLYNTKKTAPKRTTYQQNTWTRKQQTSIPRKLLNSNRTPRTKNNSKPYLLGKLQPAIKNLNA